MFRASLPFILAIAASSCSAQQPASSPSPAATFAPDNGRLIFMTGGDAMGRRITAAQRPLRSSCMQCHNANGSGGVKFPDGAVSADLRHAALVTDQHPPYTVALLERAISRGIDNQGKPLDPIMPRWKMSPRDLHDVAAFVYTKLK